MVATFNFANSCKIAIKPTTKLSTLAISHCIQKRFAASGPDCYAISKMVHYISVPQKLTELLSKMSISTKFLVDFGKSSYGE